MASLLFIHNPKAGKAGNKSFVSELSAAFPKGLRCELIGINQLNEIDETHWADVLVAVGGDGTVNAVAELCFKYNKKLAVIPRGSGDGLARHRHLPRELSPAIQTIVQGKSMTVDTITINNTFCLNVAGTGFEASVAHEFGTRTKRGILGYARAIWSLYFKYPAQQAQLHLEKETPINCPYFSLSIANGSQWGNDISIASDASMRDGVVELVVMQRPPLKRVLKLLRYLKSEKQEDTKLLKHFQAKELLIHSSEKRWHVDGEPITIDGKALIQIHPLSLEIIVP